MPGGTRTIHGLLLGAAIAVGSALPLGGCQTQHQIKVEPIEVKPIHLTVDVNIRIDRALDSFFDFGDEEPATAPAAPGALRTTPTSETPTHAPTAAVEAAAQEVTS